MKIARRMTFALAILCLTLATCVLGRAHPSSAWSEHSAVEEVEQGCSSPSSSPLVLGFLPVEVPFKQERRLLKGSSSSSSGSGSGATTTSYTGGFVHESSGGSGHLSKTAIIICSVLTVVLAVLLVAWYLWDKSKRKKDSNWSFTDYFKSKIVKMFTRTVKRDAVVPDGAAAEHKMTIDVPRLDHASKSRKQASLNHEFKSTSTFQ